MTFLQNIGRNGESPAFPPYFDCATSAIDRTTEGPNEVES